MAGDFVIVQMALTNVNSMSVVLCADAMAMCVHADTQVCMGRCVGLLLA